MNKSKQASKKFALTVEVPLFLTMFGLSLSGAAISNIILHRTCIHSLKNSKDVCRIYLSPEEKSIDSSLLEKEVQSYSTFISTVKMLIESIVPAILSLFLGVWSDKYGRKPLLVWPLLGSSLTMMLTVVYSMIDNLSPWWIILTCIPISLTGGYGVIFTGAFCYLSDITLPESRSMRMTILQAAISAGAFFGAAMSSYLLKYLGSVYLLCVVATSFVSAYAFTSMCLNESVKGASRGSLSSIFDFKVVKDAMRDCFKKRPNNLRAQILLLAFTNSLSLFIMFGLMSLDYLYTRQIIHWSMQQFTTFTALSTLISFAGSFIGMGVLSKVFKVSDMSLVVIAYLTSAAEFFIRTLATTTWHMYLGAFVSLFKNLPGPLLRSFLTKIVPSEDIAKVFVLFSAIDAVCPLTAPILYSALYTYTISSFPASIYILSAGINILCVGLLLLVFFYKGSLTTEPYKKLKDEDISQ